MQGYVRYLNMQNAMVGVETREGFTIMEIMQRCAVDISDMVTGDLHSPGLATLRNETKNEDFDVRIEHVHCNGAETLELLGIR
jgi:hypothetical protein